MRRSSTRDTSDRLGMSLTPAAITKTDVDPKLQEIEVDLPAGSAATGVSHQYPYGFAARVMGPKDGPNGEKQHAETWIMTAGGNRSHGVALPAVDRRFPCPVKLEEGEVCHFGYGSDGQVTGYTHFKKDGSTVHRGKGGQATTHGSDGSISMQAGEVTFRLSSDGIDIQGGYIKHDGKRIDATHKHGGVQSGGSKTTEPEE